jgi:hypothetical protein
MPNATILLVLVLVLVLDPSRKTEDEAFNTLRLCHLNAN